MPDLGDDVTISTTVRVDGALTNPSTMAVTVTSPSGAVTNPADTNPSTGVFQAIVPAVSEAGRWRYNWISTGPAGEDFGHFDVLGDPPPPGRLMPLATIADLEDRLAVTGVAMTDAQRTAAPALLRDASARIRRHTKKTFDLTVGDEMVLRPVGVELRLPRTPVVAVTQVEQIGAAGTADRVMAATEWGWDGIDVITLWPDPSQYQAVPPGTGYYTNTYRPRWNHGYSITPDDVVAVCCNMVNRVLTSPSFTAGLRSETIGSYSYTLGGDSGGSGVSVRLTEEDEKDLRPYRRRGGTVALRVA